MPAALLTPWWTRAARGYLSGWWKGLERLSGVRILYYHGVVERKRDSRLERNLHLVSDFEDHLALLRRFRVLKLEELSEEVSLRAAPERRPAVALTFDDGYRNNLLAAELLDRRRLPWMLAISTGNLGGGRTIWTVELSLLLLHGEATGLEVFEARFPLRTRAERELAFQEIRTRMKELPAAARLESMSRIRSQFREGETERLLEEFPSMAMLSWDEVSSLSRAGVEIGSHGRHHELHHGRQPREVREGELAISKAEIESHLGRPCRFFAYPNGTCTAESAEEVKAAGYELAFTTGGGAATSACDRYLLPRLGAAGSLRALSRDLFWEAPSGG